MPAFTGARLTGQLTRSVSRTAGVVSGVGGHDRPLDVEVGGDVDVGQGVAHPGGEDDAVGVHGVAVVELETPLQGVAAVDRRDRGRASADGRIGGELVGGELVGGAPIEVGGRGAVVAEQTTDAGRGGVGWLMGVDDGHTGASSAQDERCFPTATGRRSTSASCPGDFDDEPLKRWGNGVAAQDRAASKPPVAG